MPITASRSRGSRRERDESDGDGSQRLPGLSSFRVPSSTRLEARAFSSLAAEETLVLPRVGWLVPPLRGSGEKGPGSFRPPDGKEEIADR